MTSAGRHRDLQEWIASISSTWLQDMAGDTSLSTALSAVERAAQRRAASAERDAGPILFPLLYHHRPQVTSALFHQLIDACQEGWRTGRRVCVAGAAVGRAEPDLAAPDDLAKICEIMTSEGWPIECAGEVADLERGAACLAARARRTSYTRRAADLPDLLVAAAFDALEASCLYLAEGVIGGRGVGRLPAIAPLGRLHTAGDPFAEPPAHAKSRPAGYDQIWGAAFTLGETEDPSLEDGSRKDLAGLVRARLEPAWRSLQRAGVTAHHGLSSQDTRRMAASGPRRSTAAIPLFGARTGSAATASLVSTSAALANVVLVVDDVTPPLFYRTYDAGAVHTRFISLAAGVGGAATFLSDLDQRWLEQRLAEALRAITIANLVAASPHGKAGRSHSVFTGYDAIHLAIMAVTCALHPNAALSAQAANVSAVRALTDLHGITSLIMRSGPAGAPHEHEYRLGATWLPSNGGPQSGDGHDN